MNKTKTASTPARRKAPAAKSAPTARVIVHVHPHRAQFFQPDCVEAYSTLPNGPEGSEAAFNLALRIERLREDGVSVAVTEFDAAGKATA